MSRGTALVTGASAGIGLELCKLLAADGYDLILVARREDVLRRLAGELGARHGIQARVIAVDLSAPEAADRVFRDAEGGSTTPDILVNNAGFGALGPYLDADPAEELGMVRVNMSVPTRLTRLFLDGMIARGSGRILNVASTAAYQPGPLMSVYYATKSYLLSYSQALWEELRGLGVTVTCLCPGPTLTEFQKRARMEDVPMFKGPWVEDAATVARNGYRGMMRGKRVVISGFMNRMGALAVRFMPTRPLLGIVRRLNEKIVARR